MLTLYSSYDDLMDTLYGMVSLTREDVRNGIKDEYNDLWDIIYAFRCIFPLGISDEDFMTEVDKIINQHTLTIMRGDNRTHLEVEDGIPLKTIIVKNDLHSLTASAKSIFMEGCEINSVCVDSEGIYFHESEIGNLEITNKHFHLTKFICQGYTSSKCNNILPLPNTLTHYICGNENECVKDWRVIDWHSTNLKSVSININDYWRWGEEWWNYMSCGASCGLHICMYIYNSETGDIWEKLHHISKIEVDMDYWKVMREILLIIFNNIPNECKSVSSTSNPSYYLNWWEEYKSNPHELSDEECWKLRHWSIPSIDNLDSHINNVIIPILQELNTHHDRQLTEKVIFPPILIW